VTGGATVAQRLDQYGPAARARLKPAFDRAAVNYPPAELVLVGIKNRKVLQVWAAESGGEFAHVRDYPIVAASGQMGPKLREGDRQVPEGLYRVESLHPNSMFHLALRVNYPNEHDRSRAQADGRTDLGGDIMIHGSDGSVGCLAMGDQAAEDLFVLVADAGIERTELILTPVDFRVEELPDHMPDVPAWTDQLYSQIRQRLEQLPSPSE
jgi:murein L,D-transpeptidase YafK